VKDFRVEHRTDYRYAASVSGGHTLAHLLPRATATQRVVTGTVEVDPAPDHVDDHEDYFGNRVRYFAVQHPHDHLTVTATSELTVDVPPAPAASPPWEDVRDALADPTGRVGHERLHALEMTLDSPLVAASVGLAAFATPSFPPGRPVHEGVIDLTGRIFREFAFDPAFSDTSTPLVDVLTERRGVCQDFAHLAIGALRSLGLAARYVSGYIETEPSPGFVKLVGSDMSHAWFSAWVPGFGWFDADPTNDNAPPDRHVTVAWGRDYGDVSPLRGVVFGPPVAQFLTVSVDVRSTS
jgi:transglutaminase-like putative cysteine protease